MLNILFTTCEGLVNNIKERKQEYKEYTFMPQIEFSTYISQLFWLFLTFAAFYLVVSKLFVPRLKDVLGRRKDKIHSLIVASEDISNLMADSEKEMHSILHNARHDATVIRQAANTKLKEMLNDIELNYQTRSLSLVKDNDSALTALSKSLEGEINVITEEILDDLHDLILAIYGCDLKASEQKSH